MKSLMLSLLACFCLSWSLSAQIKDPKATEVWDPEPRVVTPGSNNSAPSDAIVLFDGSNLDAWTATNGAPPSWEITDDYMTVKKGGIKTKQQFGDCQLHIEWSAPTVIEGTGQGRGNSGVFFQERYEVQVLDSYNNRTYSNGQAASVYKQSIPLVNAMRAPGEWNVYDIIYTAPRFNEDGMRTAPGRVTVIHNGIVVQNNVEIKGTTEYIGLPKNSAHGDDSLMLQDHSNPVRYRNIWVRNL